MADQDRQLEDRVAADSEVKLAIKLDRHLAYMSHKAEFFCSEFCRELHRTPDSLKECYRWGWELLELFDHGISLLDVPTGRLLEYVEGLRHPRDMFARELAQVLRVHVGFVLDSPDAEECDRRLKQLSREADGTHPTSAAVALREEIVQTRKTIQSWIADHDGQELDSNRRFAGERLRDDSSISGPTMDSGE